MISSLDARSVRCEGEAMPRPYKERCRGRACPARRPEEHIKRSVTWGLIIDSRYRRLPVVAFPFCALRALVGQTNPQAPILDSEVQMEVHATSFQTHPPVIVSHLLQMNHCATGNDFVKCRLSICQSALRPNFQRTAVLLPNHIAIIN